VLERGWLESAEFGRSGRGSNHAGPSLARLQLSALSFWRADDEDARVSDPSSVPDVRERGAERDGKPQVMDRRLFMQLLAFDCCGELGPYRP
jgi:hypothetical protein